MNRTMQSHEPHNDVGLAEIAQPQIIVRFIISVSAVASRRDLYRAATPNWLK
jgi:hypothetical protein